MKSNPLNNKYSIYYLLYEYTQFYIYWLIIARVSFEKLVLLKIRLIIKFVSLWTFIGWYRGLYALCQPLQQK